MNPDILKSGAIIINKKKELLIVKPKNKEFWVFVGGKIEEDETPQDALAREVKEELGVNIIGEPQKYLESPIEKAAGDKQERTVQIIAYVVKLSAPPKPSAEIEKIHWLSGKEFKDGKFLLGSILQEHTIPRLLEEGLMQ